jgi:hypothetical protein
VCHSHTNRDLSARKVLQRKVLLKPLSVNCSPQSMIALETAKFMRADCESSITGC